MKSKQYKYNIGIVHLKDGQKPTITSKQLEDEGIRTKYKGEKITDEAEEVLLFIRSRGNSSHFFSRGNNRKNIRGRKYLSKEHKVKINTIHNFINARDRVRICCYTFGYKEKELDTIFTFTKYHFEKEVKQSLSRSNYFISDIFGISKSLNCSNKEPSISIEVIDSHFPDFKTFNYFREITKDTPMVILFYYLEFEPWLNQMINNGGESNNGKLRISHYIQDGSFWIGDERIEEKDFSYIKSYNSEIDFTKPEEYYKAIDELVLKKLKQKC
ncbi:hypothetical protein Tcr_0836 [Sporocytophaga myxococcoides]|uniref:Uncharacterized protein n=1 Tax=Sporocytophaga myxococcoides TaxID=153721 RepID=A0A098LK47_9BACT|nr:hypothetical protein [Sporocytophaga myxococcoides]GAL86834.1 hypothetical protein Tcr_0836 [Sporocytophaga myxococcoides]